jgi:hypothetical protein
MKIYLPTAIYFPFESGDALAADAMDRYNLVSGRYLLV